MNFNDRLKTLRTSRGLTLEQLAKKLGCSKSSVNMYERGEREPSFEMLEAIADFFNVDIDYLLGKSDVKNRDPYTAVIDAIETPIRIPVLGSVPAGIPLEAVEDIIDYEEISAEMARAGDYFGLRIRGNSMEPKISEGDVVIVRKQETVENGQIAVVMINGDDATVKKFYDTGAGVTLVGLNPTFEPLTYTPDQVAQLPLRVIGRVVELRAKF
jgi:repressor LexA